MKKLLLVTGYLLLVALLAGCNLPWQKKAALQVNSIPKAKVFIDGQEKQTTPYEDKDLNPGETTVRLEPETTAVSLSSWERKVKLVAGVMTIVNWEFGTTESDSAGEILTLEKSKEKEGASLSVISIPDSAVVRLDGEARGFTPIVLEKVTAGEREIVISANGFQDRSIKGQLITGYQLTVNVKLAKIEEEIEKTAEAVEEEETKEEGAEATPKPKPTGPTPTPPDRPYVKIKDTPTGWLRVREKATTASEEIAKVNPGEMYPLLDEESGWYKIAYEEDKEGWIAGRYAEKYE